MLILFILIALNSFVVTNYTVDGHSMDQTLHNGQLLGINRLAYLYHPPRIGDIIVVSFGSGGDIEFVKRVTGIGGQTVAGNSGQVYHLNANQLFIEGDNRGYSTDSRTYGPILTSQVIGKVVFEGT